ncbi:MAG: tetratricopeptide repeat protein [Formivibrio sp.]|nr:tetratricopeptide repeat protein [Formivibrio sp.]
MAFDLQEQEQIAELKAFWQDYGRHIALGLGLALAIFGGWKGWQAWENNQSNKASAIYAKLDAAAGDAAAIKTAAAELQKDYSRTAYAGRAALVAARAAFSASDLATAQSELNWAIANGREASIRDVARIRLANVLMDQKKYDEALSQLKSAEEQSFGALYAETRGDVLALKGDAAGAGEAYKQALAKLPKDAPNYKFVEIKLEALGSH